MSRLLDCAFERRFENGPLIRAVFALPTDEPNVTVLFGPSGSGKTTLLRCLAGLERPDKGFIRMDGEAWCETSSGLHLPPQKRSLGFVFQDGALFPHLSAAGNLAYPLHGIPRAERLGCVQAMVELLGLDGLEHRKPGELSGGQRQRVALGRALIRRPRLVLMDEPLTALDRPARDALRHDLRRVFREMAIPVLLVTHDRDEAILLGDRMLMMQDGEIQQDGPPAEVFTRPRTPALAEALGIGTVVKARVLGSEGGLVRLLAGTAELLAPDPGSGYPLGEWVHACIRGEGVAVEKDVNAHADSSPRNRVRATITGMERTGPLVRLHLDCGFPLEALVTTWACEDLALKAGDSVLAMIKATAIHLIPVM
ncbi:MAG: ABC transporter ATP-binding protein [Holophagaceae bacterium]|nr:ABC transporter ATP-binding protein [Holophagaceae bacterium]